MHHSVHFHFDSRPPAFRLYIMVAMAWILLNTSTLAPRTGAVHQARQTAHTALRAFRTHGTMDYGRRVSLRRDHTPKSASARGKEERATHCQRNR